MKTINPQQVHAFDGRIVDVRSPDEFASERLARAECVPLPSLVAEASKWDRQQPLLVMCKSGMRSKQAYAELEAAGFGNIAMLAGGLDSCKKEGVQVVTGRRTIPIMRQVMLGAGSLLLIGLILGIWYPAFYLINWFVACGMMFAGLTGNCLMAMLLDKMPWNRVSSCCQPAQTGYQAGRI